MLVSQTVYLKYPAGDGYGRLIDPTISDGKMIMANPYDKGQAELIADTDGEVIKIRIDGGYLAQALQACGGMVDFKRSSSSPPMRFSANGY